METPGVVKSAIVSGSNEPGFTMLAKLNKTGPVPDGFTWRWNIFISQIGNQLVKYFAVITHLEVPALAKRLREVPELSPCYLL